MIPHPDPSSNGRKVVLKELPLTPSFIKRGERLRLGGTDVNYR
jgi:hypothetical protein